MTGTNSEEWRLFLVPTGIADQITTDVLAGLLPALGISPSVAELYRSNRPAATPGDILAALLTDRYYRLPALAIAEARFGCPARSYVYEFAWQSPVGGLGACHDLEVPFVFDNLSASGAELVIGPGRPKHLADQMHQAWISFARRGDPGWRAFDESYPVRVFNDADGAVELDPHGDERRIWSHASTLPALGSVSPGPATPPELEVR